MMRFFTLFATFLFLSLALHANQSTAQDTPFVTIWDSENFGESDDDQIIIPGEGTDYSIEWTEVELNENGDYQEVADPTTGSDTGTDEHTVDLGEPGVYRIEISGNFSRINFGTYFGSTNGDNQKILLVEQWGDIQWDTMEDAFVQAINLDIAAEDTPDLSQVESMFRMFRSAESLTAQNSRIADWEVSNVKNMDRLFYGTDFNAEIGEWNVVNVETMANMFRVTSSFNQYIGDWDVSNVTDMSSMFSGAEAFNQDIGEWDVGSVENMSNMFNSTVDFNQDLDDWNVSNVTNMQGMFNRSESFNGEIGNWDVSSVKDMGLMFSRAEAFNQDIGDWDVSSVTDMSRMFSNATSFDQDIGDWDTESLEIIQSMFRFNEAFNQDIRQWNTENVEDFRTVFQFAESFNQSLEGWNLESAEESFSLLNMLSSAPLSPENYDLTLIGWAGQDLNDGITLGASGIEYCNSGPFRTHLIEEYSWDISDDGQATDCPNEILAGSGSVDVSSDGSVDLGTTDVRVDFDGVNGSGRVTAARFDDMPTNVSGVNEANVSPYRVIIVAGSGLSFSNATEVRFDEGAFGGISDASDITVYSRPVPGSGEFTPVNNFFYDENTGEIVAETGSFSEFIFASDSNPLPVELSGFDATLDGEEAVLQWETVSETNNAGFEVQRADGSVDQSVETSRRDVSTEGSWETIATLDGAGTTDTPQSYQFTDTDLPYAADSLRYRLRQVDTDGTESFSEAVTIARQVTDAELLPTYPNPASGQATIRYAVPDRQDVRIALYDMLGRRVQMVTEGPAEGRTEQVMDVSGLASGTYFLRMQTDSHTETQRVTVVR